MIEWLAQYSGYAVLIVFFCAFAGIAIWTYRPGNKVRLESHSQIPFREIE